MYNTTEAVKAALGQSVVRMRLLSESVSLLASDAKPIQSSDGKPIWVFAVGPFPDGKVDGEQLSSLSYSAGCCDGDIGIGNVSAASLSGAIHGVLNLLNVTFTAQVGVDVDGKTQWMNLGKFTVTESTRTDDSTTFTAYDAAYTVFGQTYTPTVLSGSTGRAILEDISRQTGIVVEPSTLALCTMQTDGALTGHTYREMVGYIAALCGKNAVITRDGFLRFVWFSTSAQTVTADDYYSGAMSNGGKSKLHGITCTIPATEDDRETQTITAGESGKAVAIVNPYMTQTILNSVWTNIGGYEYPVGNVGFYKGLLTEPGDVLSLTNLTGVTISFPVMQVALEIDGGCRCTATSYGKSEADRGTGVKSPTMQAFNRVLDGIANGIYDGTSVSSVTRFYRLGDEAPAKPTTLQPPSGWTTTEPSYAEENPPNLYFTDRTIYNNGTFEYSAVSGYSSYTAARQAYEAAQAAKDAADEAQDDANTALESANGKNKVFHRASAPVQDGSLRTGDTWFDTDDDCKMYTWTGATWAPETFGTNAISELSITNAKIANGTIQSAKIAGLDAGKITSGTISADRIGANSIDASKINVTSLFSQNITATGAFSVHNANYSLEAVQSSIVFSSKGGMGIYGEQVTVSAENGNCSIYGDLITIGDEDSKVVINGFLRVEKKSTTASISGSSAANGSLNVAKNGYTPIGVLGFSFPGTNSSSVFMFRSYIDGTTYHWGARCSNANGYRGNLDVYVLYMAT